MIITEVFHHQLKFLLADCPFLNASNAAEFKKEMHARMTSNVNHVIDLQNINFIDSTGLGVLVSCLRKADAVQGKLILCGLQPVVRTLFELVRLYKVFEIFDTREDVLRHYSAVG